jgi:hypothetical protein
MDHKWDSHFLVIQKWLSLFIQKWLSLFIFFHSKVAVPFHFFHFHSAIASLPWYLPIGKTGSLPELQVPDSLDGVPFAISAFNVRPPAFVARIKRYITQAPVHCQ